MSVIRAFIALDLATEIRQRVDQLETLLKSHLEDAPVRWVPAENIHLTLKFLGDVSVANLDLLQKILLAEASNFRPFEYSVGGLGAFPNAHHPRVVWVGVEAPAELDNLQRSIDNAMAHIGYAREERPFSAHLTLGRVSRGATSRDTQTICKVLDEMKIGFLGVVHVEAVNLYRSDLKPGGAVYSRIFSAPIKSL
jgi:RNA 2',3'-cyclic 3'-phosphodiesterase